MTYIRSAIVATVVAAAFAPLSAQTADATLNRAVEAYAKVKTVRATFSQALSNPLMGTTVTANGEIMQQRPKYFSVRFTNPAGDRIVADGKSLWIYLPSTNPGQVIRTRIGDNGAGVPDVTAQFLEAPRSRYTVSDAGRGEVGNRAARKLTLVARDSTVPFTKATIWVDDADGLVRQFEMTDANDVVRKITISELAINVPIEKSVFTFKPPRGVKVFDQGR
ncbi:MAG: outer membrane lipoprotein chaperone LolA [Anaerolineae bacterium]|nr:outer membrane lipoprotein chaperone LolA [Gemmatimonadaceae bacterium]